jgi:L,D-transpeptidase YbiS
MNIIVKRNRQQFEPEQPEQPQKESPVQPKASKPILQAIKVGLGMGMLLSLLIISLAPIFREWGLFLLPAKSDLYIGHSEVNAAQLKRVLQQSQKTVAILQRKVSQLTPRQAYLIIDTSEHLIYLKSGSKLLHQGMCSTGSYILLKSADGSEKWIFKTPRGVFRIQNKIENPVWRMPDWAFIEEGLPVPEPDSHERFERGVLGDYALTLGDGYLIHGTLYQRYLGLPVTHGCVRLGDKELEIVYQALKVGSTVFIY